MQYFVYILFSEISGKYYTGSSQNPKSRLFLHNNRATKSTISGIPWRMVYTEIYTDKSSALKREKEIKRKKSSIFIKGLISSTT